MLTWWCSCRLTVTGRVVYVEQEHLNVTYIGVQHEFNFRWYLSRLTVTRRVSIVKKELLTLPKHPGSPTVVSGIRVARSLVFCVIFCRSLYVLLSLFFCSLYCLAFYDLRLLITLLGSSNLSWTSQDQSNWKD